METRKVFSIKRCILLLAGMLLGVVYSEASNQPIHLSVERVKPTSSTPGFPKRPVQVPALWQDGYELTFESTHPDYTLDLLQDDVVVYSVVVPADATIVTLPSWLSGSYEIELHTDSNYYFYGIINLGIII